MRVKQPQPLAGLRYASSDVNRSSRSTIQTSRGLTLLLSTAACHHRSGGKYASCDSCWGNRHSHSRGQGVGVRGRCRRSKIPEPPPGTQLPPSMRWSPECISETKPPAPHARTSVPVDEKGSCDFDTTTDANAATLSWSVNCAWFSGSKSNTEGVVHFHDDTLDGTTTIRASFPNLPTQEYSSPIKGLYLGPCDPK
jgi:hypothetical protein